MSLLDSDTSTYYYKKEQPYLGDRAEARVERMSEPEDRGDAVKHWALDVVWLMKDLPSLTFSSRSVLLF